MILFLKAVSLLLIKKRQVTNKFLFIEKSNRGEIEIFGRRHNIKKLLSIVSIVVLIFSLSACQQDSDMQSANLSQVKIVALQ